MGSSPLGCALRISWHGANLCRFRNHPPSIAWTVIMFRLSTTVVRWETRLGYAMRRFIVLLDTDPLCPALL